MECCFTICSNNYIYKAQVLATSIQALSDVPVYLFLADERSDKLNYSDLKFTRVFFMDDLGIPNPQWMKENYSVVELNTAIKPFVFSYLFAKHNYDRVYFFDPDIKFFQPLSFFESFWGSSSILLTPHVLSPLPYDNKFPEENLFLNHGIYNLGFLALKNTTVTHNMISWWGQRLLEKCVIKLGEGYFVDQIWFNLVPLFFKDVTVIDHKGCNVAYWNLHERNISYKDSAYLINNQDQLIFYHFSGVDLQLRYINKVPDQRYGFEDQPDLKQLYQEYINDFSQFDPDLYATIPYFNGRYPLPKPRPSLIERISKKTRSLLNV